MARQKGFGTLYQKKEGGVWYVRWTYKGIKKAKSTNETNYNKACKVAERITRMTREEKEIDALKNLENKIAEKTSILNEEKKRGDGILLDDLVDIYERSLVSADLAESSKEVYVKFINRFINWVKLYDKSILEMNQIDKNIATTYMTCLASEASSNIFNNTLIILKKIWNTFKDRANISVNPWSDIPKRKAEISNRQDLTREELFKLLSYVRDDEDMLCLFSLAIYTGLRLGDCCNIKWSNIDLAQKIITITPAKTKRYTKNIVIPIQKDLFKILLLKWEKKGENELVMPKIANNYKTRNIGWRIRNIFHNCGIKTFEVVNGRVKILKSFHSFRHTFVSMNINNNMSPLLIQKLVGHSAMNMTQHYFHANQTAMVNGLNQMPNLLEGSTPQINTTISYKTIEKLKEIYDESIDGSLDGTIQRLIKLYEDSKNVVYV